MKKQHKAAPQFSAAAGHRRNDAYMEEFDVAHDEFVGRAGATAARPPAVRATAPNGGTVALPERSVSAADVPPPARLEAGTWATGPRDPAGVLSELSERPLLAMALNPRSSEVVIAGSDHALYTVDMLSGRKTRTLYGKTAGHSEWVTSCTYLGDGTGRVASAGMDGKVCVWGSSPASAGRPVARAAPSSCTDLLGHFGSVSLVLAPGGGTATAGPASAEHGRLLVSAGYDKSVRLWDPAGRCLAVGTGHKAPVLCAALHAGPAGFAVLSGDRDGVARVWDASSGAALVAVGTLAGHAGHLTAANWLQDGAGGGHPIALTGAQDGHLRAWDVRAPPASSCVANVAAHAAAGGSGAIGDIIVTDASPGGGGGDSVVITSGADRRIVVTDPRAGWRPRAVLGEHRDFIYTVHAAGPLVFSGAGDGVMLAHDISGATDGGAGAALLWGVGANKAAVRCITASGRRLVAAGDDGSAITWTF
jgi:WD40 repeat protein